MASDGAVMRGKTARAAASPLSAEASMVAGSAGYVQSPAKARFRNGRRGGRGGEPGTWRGVARRSFTTRQGAGASGHAPGRPKASAACRNSAQARGASMEASSRASASPR
jgi:hypothetical protein